MKFFVFSGRFFPPPKGRGKKPGTAGFLVNSETNDVMTARRNDVDKAAGCGQVFVFVGKSPQNRAFAGASIKGPRVFPDQNEKAYSFVVKPA